MSIKIMSAIFETEFRDLQLPPEKWDSPDKPKMAKASSIKITMLSLADHANDDGECYPGLTRLELKTGLSRQGVLDVLSAIKYNGLAFISEEPSRVGSNFYTINFECFPKLKDKNDERLLVKPLDYPSQATLPELVKPLDLNHHLTINKPSISDETKSKILQDSDPAWSLLAGEKIGQEQVDAIKLEKEALDIFEMDMNLPKNWSWYPAKSSEEKAWKDLRDFVVAQYKKDSKCFQTYQTWRTQPFARGAMSNLAIRRNPENFPASWTDFLASNAMYGKKDAPEVKKDDNGITISYI